MMIEKNLAENQRFMNVLQRSTHDVTVLYIFAFGRAVSSCCSSSSDGKETTTIPKTWITNYCQSTCTTTW